MLMTHEEYGVFFRASGSTVDSVIVNLAVCDLAPIVDLPSLVVVSIPLRDPSSQGLGGPAERRLLNELEAALAGALQHGCDAVFIGRVLGHGKLTCYFQAPAAHTAHPCVSEVLKEFPSYGRYQLNVLDDPDWESYFIELYPDRAEFETMTNHSRQAQAWARGSRLEDPVPICHWAYFPDVASRNAFLARIAGGGYRARLRECLESEELEAPFCVELTRVDRADHPYLDQLVLNLFALAEECGGYYDGYVADVFAASAA